MRESVRRSGLTRFRRNYGKFKSGVALAMELDRLRWHVFMLYAESVPWKTDEF